MTSNQVSYTDQTLKIGEKEIRLDYPVQKTIIQDDVVIVLTEPPAGEDVRDNIQAFDMDGEKLWDISPVSKKDLDSSVAYIDISIHNDQVLAHNWNGGTYEVNIQSGGVNYQGWSK